MKRLFVVLSLIFSSSMSHAAYGGEKAVTGLLGFTQSALNIGANFESRASGPLGYGGMFHLSSEKKDDDTRHRFNNHQTIAFGGLMFMHLLESTDLDVYIAPGAAITMVKGIKNQVVDDDQTTLTPVWKIGAFMRYSTTFKYGFEQTQIVNWLSDKLPANYTYTNFAVSWSL